MTTDEHCFELSKEQFDELICGNGTQFRDGNDLYYVSASCTHSPDMGPSYRVIIIDCAKSQSIILNPTAESVKAKLIELLHTQETSANTVAMGSFKAELAHAS